MADKDSVPEADALEQSMPPNDADPELLDVEDDAEIGVEVSEADAVEQSRARAVPAAWATPAHLAPAGNPPPPRPRRPEARSSSIVPSRPSRRAALIPSPPPVPR